MLPEELRDENPRRIWRTINGQIHTGAGKTTTGSGRDGFEISGCANKQTSVPLSENKHLLRWVEKMAELTRPAAIHWVDGSQEEYRLALGQMVAAGTFTKLNQDLWPGCYLARSVPR